MNQRVAGLRCVSYLAGMLLVRAFVCVAADVEEGRKELLAGNYARCIALGQAALKEREDREDWQLLLSEALWMTGRYPEARTVITNAVADEQWRLRLRWQARKILQSNGQPDAAKEMVEQILRRVSSDPRSYQDAPSLVVFGQAALLGNADPKSVLDKIFDSARKANPKMREVHLAAGELALDKHDFKIAAQKFQEGLKQLPDDPDLHCGLARAYEPSDAALMMVSIEAALARNSNHIGSLLLLAEHHIDAEDYDEAAKLLDRVKAVNPWHPDLWAYRAVLAHLQNQPESEKSARQSALKFWPTNPRVDHLIGLKLSQKYRFTEGAACQRQALEYDEDYLPAKAQLSQDLLRLGEEAEGWELANEVHKKDGYDVAAYNLADLHDKMDKLATLTNGDFMVRMAAHEAEVYGQRVLELLGQARSNLCAKYGFEVKRPTIVEIFPQQADFAVRTFGMPGNPGYLGVCFGTVITANSPAANPGHAINWQAVLWHEFCHVVTLQISRNKMPRWLSEGISVYEEIQANPTWGQHMTPQYREMVLGDELTPVSELSAAFLTPPSEHHLQFAYYESSLVVEFLVQRYGLDSLKGILHDLGGGVEINQAIEKHSAPMAKIEKDFAAFARERAEKLAPGLDWEKPEFLARPSESERGRSRRSRPRPTPTVRTNAPIQFSVGRNSSATNLTEWIATHPTNFYALTERAGKLIEEKKFQEAKAPLQKLVELYPAQTGGDSAYSMLAHVHHQLGETNAERQILKQLAERDNEATDAYSRLMELGAAAQDWPAVTQNAQRYLAVNPLVPSPYRFLAQASEHRGESQSAIGAYRALLQLDPPDPAETHFRLAQLLDRSGDPAARRHVLQALEEAPRYQAALQLLLEINKKSPQPKTEELPRVLQP